MAMCLVSLPWLSIWPESPQVMATTENVPHTFSSALRWERAQHLNHICLSLLKPFPYMTFYWKMHICARRFPTLSAVSLRPLDLMASEWETLRVKPSFAFPLPSPMVTEAGLP